MKKILILLILIMFQVAFCYNYSVSLKVNVRVDYQNETVKLEDYYLINEIPDEELLSPFSNCMLLVYYKGQKLTYDLPDYSFIKDAKVSQLTLPYDGYKSIEIICFNRTFKFRLNLCDNDNKCEDHENFLSCPDCKIYNDNTCIDAIDNICDPDCYNDPDCKNNYAFIIILLVLITIVLLLLFIKKKK